MKHCKTIFVSIMLLALALAAKAQTSTNDFGTWASLQVFKSFGKPYASVRGEHRTYDMASKTEAWFLMAMGGYKFTPWLSGDISYEYWQIMPNTTMNHKAVFVLTGTLKRDNLSVALREKYELAINPAYVGTETNPLSHVLRTRLRVQYALKEGMFTPYAMFEFFTGFNKGDWVRTLHYVGCEFKFAKHNVIDLFYMYHAYAQFDKTVDYALVNGFGSRHLLGIGYMFVF